jgi:hydrogenase maturation factor
MALEYSWILVGCGAAIKRLSRAKRKQKLTAYALFIKMWMNRRPGMRDA